MFGFLLQWPTLLTLAMFPVLVLMYVRLAMSEERDSQKAFGDAWTAYAAETPRFIPRWDLGHDGPRARTHCWSCPSGFAPTPYLGIWIAAAFAAHNQGWR